MNIALSQQVSATYARNNFKEVNEKVQKQGMCVIVKKSTPITILLSMEEYQKITSEKAKTKKPIKISISQIRKNSLFQKYVGCLKGDFKGKTSQDLQKNWTDYVD